MKKILSGVMMLGLFVFASPALAVAPNWTLDNSTAIAIVFGCGASFYSHTLNTVLQDGNGDLVGTGTYDPNPGYTWDLVGNISGDNITFTITYTGLSAGSVYNSVGVIAEDGSISGTTDSNCQSFSMLAGSATALDEDEDGVLDEEDYCLGTTDDSEWSEGIGQNRWQVIEGIWNQHKVKKGVVTETPGEEIDYTYGCNGHQILDELYEKLGSVMNGHRKFGLSSSVVEDFHNDLSDGVLDGRYYLETVVVPASDADGVSSTITLLSGQNYVFKASGTAFACNQLGCVIPFDAEYSTSDGTNWVDGVAFPYDSYGVNLLDLMVDGGFENWDDDATYNIDHTYWLEKVGSGATVNFTVNDTHYPSNSGSLTVDIYAEI